MESLENVEDRDVTRVSVDAGLIEQDTLRWFGRDEHVEVAIPEHGAP